MTLIYRILRRPYANKPLSGEGAFRFGGRWSSPGTRLAYAAEHLSLAMIEYFVHIDPSDPPKDLALVTIEVSDEISRLAISPKQLRPDWRVTPAPSELASFGDNFVKEGRAAILTVPSALAPAESNWLINPQHPDFGKLRVHPVEEFEYDVRFFK